MSKIDIKVGETYNVRVKVTEKMGDKIITCVVSDNGLPLEDVSTTFYRNEALAFSPVPRPAPINFFKMTEIPEAYPKHDPCRLFRERDKVRVKREVHGRPVYIGEDAWEPCDPDEIWTVEEDELETGWVRIKTDCVHATVWHAMLELVTPVEELGPYVVRHNEVHSAWSIYGPFNLSAVNYFYGESYPYTKETAKAAAEAERDRLNAEYRKELEK